MGLLGWTSSTGQDKTEDQSPYPHERDEEDTCPHPQHQRPAHNSHVQRTQTNRQINLIKRLDLKLSLIYRLEICLFEKEVKRDSYFALFFF